MIQIAWPWALAAVLLPLVMASLKPVRSRGPGALRIPFYHRLTTVSVARGRKHRWKVRLAVLAWLALVLAAARPQWVGDSLALPQSGRNLMLAVDLSESMRETDQWLDGTQVSRLRAVQELGGDFIGRRRGDRVGLILFGSRPYVQVPLTFDRSLVQSLLRDASVSLVGSSTALGDAVGLAVKRLRSRPAESSVLILISDGVNNAGVLTPQQAAWLARAHGLRVHTIGVGSTERQAEASDDTALDERGLQTLAEISGGEYFRARNGFELGEIYGLLDELEPISSDAEHLRPLSEIYWLPLAAAFGFALMAFVPVLVGQLREWRCSGQATG